ncbi:MAG: HEAT repeat domain-containing protein [Planctomycetes bacterium]|nr:HEAT repeat domain-containing protein [Planctomycetota bacterium]
MRPRNVALAAGAACLALGTFALLVSGPERTGELSFDAQRGGRLEEARGVERRVVASPEKNEVSPAHPPATAGTESRGEGARGAEAAPDRSWQDGLFSPDAAERCQAIDLMPRNPSAESRTLLLDILARDEDAYVRERAVFALAERFGRDAVARLKELALTDAQPDIRAAAMASLHRIDRMEPLPPRGRLEIECPAEFDAGGIFELTARFTSVEDSPRAILEVMLPDGLELVSPEARLWKGSAVAGRAEEVRFAIRVEDRTLQSAKIRVHLKFDYSGRLDAEILDREVRLKIVSGKGSAVVPENPQTRERTIVLD